MPWRWLTPLLFAAHATACSCGGVWPSAKQAWQQSPVVFLGTVEVADPDKGTSDITFVEQRARIRVDEAFKGVTNGQAFEMLLGGTDCSAKFRTGQKAVFYLRGGKTPDTWYVPPCTHSLGSAEPLGDDLLFLRGLPRSAEGTRFSGEIAFYEASPTDSFHRIGGAAGVKINIRGEKGFIKQAVTNAAGVYEVFGLPSGKYSVEFLVPAGWKTTFPIIGGASQQRFNNGTVDLPPNGGVNVSFVLEADTRLSGYVLDSDGERRDHICLALDALAGRSENGAFHFTCSKDGGVFSMEDMPPGKYVLLTHDEIPVGSKRSKSTLYYPGVRDRQKASVITVEAGKYVHDVVLRLPSDEQRYTLSGQVQFADGVPASSVTLTFTSEPHGYTETTITSRDGTFALSVVPGIEGQLAASFGVMMPILAKCPEVHAGPRTRGMFRFIDATPITIKSDSDHLELKLELPSPSCKAMLR